MSWSHDLRQLQPWLLQHAEWLLGQLRTGAQITSVYRSPALQSRLYRRRQEGKHPYPVAPPGTSLHEYGLAWDMIAPPEELRRLGAIWTRRGGRWGGARDPIHFEAGPRMLKAHRVVPVPRIAGVSAGASTRQAATRRHTGTRGR